MNTPLRIFLLGTVLVLAGCATGKGGDTYSRDEARHVQTVLSGTVEGIRDVTIDGTHSGIGAGAGAVVGGIAGSGTGQGRGSSIGAVLGAVAGGVVGAIAEEGSTREKAQELTIRLDSGRVISVVQGGKERFRPGDYVHVIEGRETRVTH